ncbi:MAG: hypothetical protein NT023_23035 [Armatimonadetes bacterium]|nr:hypothetical protein [Armatimonadota bacterium]
MPITKGFRVSQKLAESGSIASLPACESGDLEGAGGRLFLAAPVDYSPNYAYTP